MAASLDKIVANLHLNDGADPGEAVDHHRNQRAVAQAEEIRLSGRLWIISWFLGNGDAPEQRMGFLNRQDRRLAFLDRVARASHLYHLPSAAVASSGSVGFSRASVKLGERYYHSRDRLRELHLDEVAGAARHGNH